MAYEFLSSPKVRFFICPWSKIQPGQWMPAELQHGYVQLPICKKPGEILVVQNYYGKKRNV